ncbi:hypothetical protein AVEN_151015-1 [Araneus ventricosus]|uniref:Uncharacterized protein n=1 Tax=Araneus ventricosus TaxID=182803 RepID=A0A4Y2S705_ARAVE|nr:hypothetical protein AVEN_151015-1 [Araneus ventricosus]
MMRTKYELVPPLQISAPHQRVEWRQIYRASDPHTRRIFGGIVLRIYNPSDLSCIRPTYTTDLRGNRVTNLQPVGFIVHQTHIHGGPSVESCYESATRRIYRASDPHTRRIFGGTVRPRD